MDVLLNPPLRTEIAGIFDMAGSSPGAVCALDYRDLRIYLKVTPASTWMMVRQSRIRIGQSAWQLVLENLPYPFIAAPDIQVRDGLAYYSAAWPTPAPTTDKPLILLP